VTAVRVKVGAASAAILVVLVGVAGYAGWRAMAHGLPDLRIPDAPGCVVQASGEVSLDSEQMANAATISAVGIRLKIPTRGMVVALATAMQESKLRNLPGGDRDSIGLFQQRPSQGWGSETEVLTPHYAAGAFYRRLARVRGWESLPVTTAAQRVQHSGAPLAYAQWEHEARAIAQAATGEIPAGLSCRVNVGPTQASGKPLRQALTRELGPLTLDVPVPEAHGWTVAAWLIGHAPEYGISQVSFADRIWTASSGRWVAYNGPVDMTVRVTEER
jgi:hypothetical protein